MIHERDPINKTIITRQQLLDELQELTSRVMEAEETLRAIRDGEVDGLVVSRKERALIAVNCAALPANLIESELFGREKETMKTLQDYPWPGNVRELESIIERP